MSLDICTKLPPRRLAMTNSRCVPLRTTTDHLRLLLVLQHRSRWPGNATGTVSDLSILSTGVGLHQTRLAAPCSLHFLPMQLFMVVYWLVCTRTRLHEMIQFMFPTKHYVKSHGTALNLGDTSLNPRALSLNF
jgi:hypothetical protein